MKCKILVFISAMMLTSQIAFADPANAARLSAEQKREIAWAIHVLAQTHALYRDKNSCGKFDSDIIQELIKEGLLSPDDSAVMSICIGATE